MSKSLVRNSIYNIIYKGFTALFPLLTTSYVSRVLLAEGVGKVSYANTIVTYFVSVASLGIPNYGIKAIAQSNKDGSQLSRTAFELILINFISTSVCLVCYYCFVNNFSYFAERKYLFNIMGILLFLNYFNLDWFYQGIEEYAYISKRSIVVKIASFVMMLLFVKKPEDYVVYTAILCAATAGNNLFNAYNLRKYVDFTKNNLDLKKHLKPVFILLASTIATEIYTMLDSVMLEYYYGELYVGYYSNSVKLIRMIYTLTIAMVGAFYPRISQYFRDNQIDKANMLLAEGTKYILLVAVPAMVGIFLTVDYLVDIFFGESFAAAVGTIKILCPLVVVFSIAYFLGSIVLMAVGKEKLILRATIFGAISNFCMNMYLIPIYKHNGAALASVFAEIFVTVILVYYAKKHYKLQINVQYWISLLFSVAVMSGYVVLMRSNMNNGLVSGVVIIMGAVVLYVLSLVAFKNEVITKIIDVVLKKIKKA